MVRLPLSTTHAKATATRPRDVLNVAHWGASSEVAENTLAAIRRALACDADVVEVDVHRARDGELVLIHDTSLVRTTDARRVFPNRAPWRIADFSYAELQRLDAGSPGSRASLPGNEFPPCVRQLKLCGQAAPD